MKKLSAGGKVTDGHKVMSVRIPAHDYARLVRAAKAHKRSVSGEVNYFLARCLDTASKRERVEA